MTIDDLEIAILVPCHNEKVTIGQVVNDFRRELPHATVYVYDNNSTDDTGRIAAAAGAVVRSETQQGKGHVVRRMFSDIEASVFVLVDGDDTYDSTSVRRLIDTLLDRHVDTVNARRVTDIDKAYRFGHQSGNRMLTGIVNWLFGERCDDILSGYRVFSRRFVKSFPALSTGFEIETELTVHGLSLNMPMAEVDTPYKERPDDSNSKLNTYRDGLRILWTIMIAIEWVRSRSQEGGGIVWILAEQQVDFTQFMNDVKIRVDSIASFPRDIEPPQVRQWVNQQEFIRVAVHGDLTEQELKRLAEQLRREAAVLPAITVVQLFGVRREEVSVQVSEEALRRYGMSFNDVAAAIRNNSINQSSGSVRTEVGTYQLKVRSQADTEAEFSP